MKTKQKRAAVFIAISAVIGCASTITAVTFAALVPMAFGLYSYLKAENV